MSAKLPCVIAAFALILMIAAVSINAIYIKRTADNIINMIDNAENFGSNSREAVLLIAEQWKKNILLLRLSLSQKELDDISLIIDEAQISANNEDIEEYKKSMARLKRAIESIKNREKISIENIF